MNLDDLKQIKKQDQEFVSESISELPNQITQVLQEAKGIKIPKHYKNITHVVINGMGGSNLGARMIKSVFGDRLRVPILIEPGYEVPNYVGKNTLYIIYSYSGTTEEPISVYREVKKRGAKIIVSSSNNPKSKLKKMMTRDKIPGFVFTPEFNPSNQPRLGLGYSVFAMISLLAQAGIFKLNRKEVKDIIKMLEENNKNYIPETKQIRNQAKKFAKEISGKMPIYVTSEFLAGNAHVLRNQTNENSKNFATYLEIPELNHYSMEGLAHPKTTKKDLIFLLFESNLYHPRVQKRNLLTKKIVKKNGLPVLSHQLKSKTKLSQSFEMLQFGVWMTYYLGMLNGVDPVKIPWVDMFKKELA